MRKKDLVLRKKLLKRKRKSSRVEILATQLGFGIEQKVSGFDLVFAINAHHSLCFELLGGSDTTKSAGP